MMIKVKLGSEEIRQFSQPGLRFAFILSGQMDKKLHTPDEK